LPGTEYSVPLAQTQLARAMANVDVLAYPSIFPETSCIAVMEAMASNTLVITTKIGALEETTAGFGFLLDLNADRYVLIRDYAALVVRVITQANSNREATLERLSSQRRYAIENYSWAARARQWFEWLAGVAGGRS
jgi:glycosyltransferase involved in cell wall biosynthesis